MSFSGQAMLGLVAQVVGRVRITERHCAQVLLNKGVQESKILFLTLIAAPEGLHNICTRFPKLTVVTSGPCLTGLAVTPPCLPPA